MASPQSSLPGLPIVNNVEMLRNLIKKIDEVRAMKMSVADTALAGRELSLNERGDLKTGCQRVATQLREIVLALT